MNTYILNQAYQLSLEDQLELVEAIWNNIAQCNAAPYPTVAQQTELDRRYVDYIAHQESVIPWNEVKE